MIILRSFFFLLAVFFGISAVLGFVSVQNFQNSPQWIDEKEPYTIQVVDRYLKVFSAGETDFVLHQQAVLPLDEDLLTDAYSFRVFRFHNGWGVLVIENGKIVRVLRYPISQDRPAAKDELVFLPDSQPNDLVAVYAPNPELGVRIGSGMNEIYLKESNNLSIPLFEPYLVQTTAEAIHTEQLFYCYLLIGLLISVTLLLVWMWVGAGR